MAFFHNRTVNLLNLHYVIAAAAVAGGGAFYAVWMLQAGIPLAFVLLTLALVFAVRFLLRLVMLPLAIRFGLKPLVIAGSLLMGLVYVVLAYVRGLDATLLRFVLVSAAADIVYWPSYHAYYAALGDETHRGRQLGAREAAAAVAGIVSPLAMAGLMVSLGPHAAFDAAGAVAALAAVPLLFTPQVVVARNAPGSLAAAMPGALLFVGDGVIQSGFTMGWQLVLFLALRRDVLAYGGAQAAAALAGAVGGLLLGRLIDAGRGGRAVWLAGVMMAAVVMLRAGADSHPVLAVTANALGALANCLFVPTLMTAMYNLAKRSPCVMRFHLVAEAGWDIGAITGLCLMAALVGLGVAPGLTLLVSLAGLGWSSLLLRRYYAGAAARNEISVSP